MATGNVSHGITANQALAALVSEGYLRGDVVAAIDSLIDTELELPQPDDHWVFTQGEVEALRAQLR